MTALQDLYPENYAHCHGCGRLNVHGLHVQSNWHEGTATAHFTPAPHHIAFPGYVYGGLIACLVDCHAMATAAAAAMEAAGEQPGRDPTRRFVTASLQVDYLKPTPMGVELVLFAHATEVRDRKVEVAVRVMAGDMERARGRVTAVRLPAHMEAATG